jgi:cullin 4
MSAMRRARPQRELIMEGFMEIPKLPPDFAKTSWVKLKTSLKELISIKPMLHGRESLYQIVNTLCNNGDTDYILQKLLKFLFKHTRAELDKLQNFQGDFHEFINQYDQHWEKYQKNLERVMSVFMFLEGEIKSRGEKGISRIVNTKYREELLGRSSLYNRLIDGILKLIFEERSNEVDNKLQLKRIILMLEKLDLYNHKFYSEFIKETDEFYANISRDLFESTSVPEYLISVEKALKKEQERIENYLSISYTRDSIAKVEIRMIKEMADQIIDKGMKPLIDSNKIQDMKLLYKLLKQVDMLPVLEAGFSKVVKQTGLSIVSAENEKELISVLLDYREKIENIMIESFENSLKFKYTIKTVWEEFVNTNANIGILCAKDLDEHLKKSSKIKLTELELENRIEGILNIFKFINSKDIFEAFYFQQLAKRLLLDKSKSNDIEKSVIAKLKAECGSTFISRLSNMQKDIDFSKTYMENFKNENSLNIDFHVWALTGSSWPRIKSLSPLLTRNLQDLQDKYTKFYTDSMKKRILNWNSSMSYCELQCNLSKGNKSLIVSLHQALILLLFNDKDSIPILEISNLVNLPLLVVKKEVSQICIKSRILTKKSKGKDLEDTEIIQYNPDFSHKFYKITINSLQIKETKIETQQTIEKVLSERQYVIDAVIVRIMKSRRTLTHSGLLSECFTNLRFSVVASDIKKRIERLIEQEYLKRDEQDRSLYHYIT